MTRGYIKEVPGNAQVAGDHMRMRFVQAGYNADSESVPPNKVIFDSDDLGTLSIITSGVFRFVGSASPLTQTIASWSDLGYVPLCQFQFQLQPNSLLWDTALHVQSTTPHQQIIVNRTGITATIQHPYAYVDIAYQVYRLAVV